MRQIKFRAWDKDDKKMILVGDIHKLLWAFGSEDNWERTSVDEVYRHLGYMRRCGDYEIMQFTGLLDKNGKEIYEGDIVLRHGKYASDVRYVDGAFKLPRDITINNDWLLLGEQKESVIEVIGNIYENPELLQSEPKASAA